MPLECRPSRLADIGSRKRILVVAPVAPPYGGMQLQASLLIRMLDADGFPVILLAANPPLPRWMESLRGVRPFLRALLFCRKLWHELGEADVVHVMVASWLYFFVVVYPAIILSRIRRKRVVLTYHGGEAGRFLSSWAAITRPAFRLATVITAPSTFLKQVLESRTHIPVSIVPNIVDLSAFRYRARPIPAPRMLVTRHLEKMYDIPSVLRAFCQIQARYAHASLEVAGTGSEEAHLRSLVSAWNLKNVRFLGKINYANLPALYDQCDVFLNASRVDNFPGALLEASASGLVVITTRAGGIPFLYEDRKDALLVDVGDFTGLAQAVHEVLENPALGYKLAENGLKLARRFEWSEVGKGFLKAYGYDQYAYRQSYDAAAIERT